jgi:uncharacterized protein DUF2171
MVEAQQITHGSLRLRRRAYRNGRLYQAFKQDRADQKRPKSGGQHRIIPLDWVEKIDDKVRLKKSAKDAMTQWQTAA